MAEITHDQLDIMLEICRDIQYRLPGLGMPELDQDFAEMVNILQAAHDVEPEVRSSEGKTDAALKREREDRVPVPPKIVPLAEAKEQHKPKHR